MAAIPTSVGIVWGFNNEGLDFGCTISSLVSSSIEQQNEELLFLLKKNSRTGAEIRRAKNFKISILATHQIEVAKSFSSGSSFTQQNHANHFAEWPHNVVSEFTVQFVECYERNAAFIYIAKVLNVRHSSEIKPLVYYNREFTQLAE